MLSNIDIVIWGRLIVITCGDANCSSSNSCHTLDGAVGGAGGSAVWRGGNGVVVRGRSSMDRRSSNRQEQQECEQ